ncbi:MAG: maleylacetoacetate isomerase [Pseudomonadota bacterium]
MLLQLYGYFRSSAAYRVRIALETKGLAWENLPVHLLREGGEQFSPAYRAVNPEGLVPTLRDGGVLLSQSLAILEYLEETHPARPLLPPDAAGRALVRAMAAQIACDIHPLNNLRVLKYLEHRLGVSPEMRTEWIRHWIGEGFTALEARFAAQASPGRCCFGDTVTLADCCLVPQVLSARRFGVDMAAFARIAAIDAYLCGLPAFQAAAPAAQWDAE